jgi:hypothetical protein
MDSIFINVSIKNHSSMILGLNTYEVINNELYRTMAHTTNKNKEIELKINFKDLVNCKSGCG